MEEYAVEMRHISKEFAGVKSSRDISLKLSRQEIHALVGENGSGKTVLMRILAGSIIPESGVIYKDRKKLELKSPIDALDNGIGMVYKDSSLVESFTAVDNILIGVEPVGHLNRMKREEVLDDIKKIIARNNLKIDLSLKVSAMTPQMKLNVAIAKLLYRKVDILLFDEPFYYLDPEEAENFKVLLLNLANDGCAILISSKKVREVRDIADKCTVLKEGNSLGTVTLKEASDVEIEKLVYGREALPGINRGKPQIGEPVLCLRNMSIYSEKRDKDIVNKVNFDVKSGEITCLLGLVDSGNIEIIYGIGGIIPVSNGNVIIRDVDLGKLYEEYKPINNKRYVGTIDITNMPVRRRNLAGLSQVPQDKGSYGIISSFNLKENLILQQYYRPEFSKGVFLNQRKIKEYTQKLIEEFEIESYLNEPVDKLSELSKQKLMLAREIDRSSKILVATNPSYSLDYQSSMEIRLQMIKKRDMGTAVLIASNDVDEALNFSDRILVVYKGRIVADVRAEEANADKLKMYMSGLIRMKNMDLYKPIIRRKKVLVRHKTVKRKAEDNNAVDFNDGNVIHKKIIKKTIVNRRSRTSADSKKVEHKKISPRKLKKIKMKNLVQYRDKGDNHEKNKKYSHRSYYKDNILKVVFSDRFIKFSSSITSTLIGIILGFIVLMIIDTSSSLEGLGYIFTTGFSSSEKIAEFIYTSAPIAMSGLAFAFAYRAKIINLGVPGQFAFGAFIAIVFALLGLPWYLNIILAFIAGAIWGLLPGLMKVYFNVDEIPSTVMFDWIAVTIIYICLSNMPSFLNADNTSTADISLINSSGIIPGWGLENWNSNFSIAIFIAIIFAVLVQLIIFRTKFGYEMRGFASSKKVAKAVGISSKNVILKSLVISGGLAGVGGALLYLSPYSSGGYAFSYSSLPLEGITGIAVAILAFNNPVACIFTSLVFSYISVSGDNLMRLGYSSSNISFIIGFIIYFGSFGVILNNWIRKRYISKGIKKLTDAISKIKGKADEARASKSVKKITIDEWGSSIVDIANSNVEKYYKEEEKVSTSFIEYSENREDKNKITIKLNPESEDLADYNPDHYANVDMPQLKRNKKKNKKGRGK